MTIEHTEPRPGDQTPLDDLDRLLDDLHTGRAVSVGSLDEGLVATARAVASLADRPASDPAHVDADALWHRLMRGEPREVTPVARGAGTRLGLVSSPATLSTGRFDPFAVVRLAAAIAAVVLVSMTATSLYSELTGGQTTPTVMAAGVDGETSATVPAPNGACSTTTVLTTSTVAPATRSTVIGSRTPISSTEESCHAD